MSQTSRSASTRADAVALTLILAASAATLFVVLQAPPEAGAWQDDGVYLVTARSLAAGEGYRRPELPGHPWQTKYPPLWPMLLSLVWRAAPTFPENVWLMRTLSTMLSAAGGCLSYALVRRAWRVPPWLAAGGILTALINPAWTGLLKTPMSEPLFLLLTSAALFLVSPPPSAPRARPVVALRGIVGGLLAGAACLARSVAIGLLIALPLTLVARRQWRAALSALLFAAAVQLAWSAWKSSARAANASLPAISALSYELDYAAWMPRTVSESARVAWFNSIASVYAVFNAIVAPAERWVWESLATPVAAVPLYAGMALVTLLIAIGLWSTWSPASPSLHLFLALYLGVVLLWPFPPSRFAAAVLPYLNTALLAGTYILVAGIVRLFDQSAQNQPDLRRSLRAGGTAAHWSARLSGASPARVVASLLCAALVLRSAQFLFDLRAVRDEAWRAAELEFVDSLARLTPPDAVIAGDNGGYYHVLTGRQFVLPLPIESPIPLLYSHSRRFGLCGVGFTEAERAAVCEHVAVRMPEYLRDAGVTFYIQPEEDSMFGGCRRQLVDVHPEWFRMILRRDIASLYTFNSP